MAISINLTRTAWRDYLALTKPRIVLLHLLTATAAMFLAARGLPTVSILAATLIGGALAAGASNALNCYFDRDIDKLMVRTRNRPLPSGRINPSQALIFAVILGLAGLLILSRVVNYTVAVLALAALAYYVPFYTLWLKRHSTWSTVIGSGAGAFPPLIGWIAVTGEIALTPFLLFVIVALWSPPHFWSLAIFRQRDYETAGLGVVPEKNTLRWIAGFSIFLVLATLFLIGAAGMGILYSVVAPLLGIVLLILVIRLQTDKNAASARPLYLYSVIYLFILFGAMLLDPLVFF